MKKILLLFLAVTVFIFGGCSAKENGIKDKAPVVPQSYTADLFIEYGNKTSQAKFVQRSLGDCEIEFVQPNTVKGLKISYSGTKCTLSFGALSLNADLASLPESNFGETMIEAFKAAVQDTTIEKIRMEDKWKYDGETSGKKFVIIQDAKTGFFESFEVPAYDLKIELKNITVQ